MAQWVDLPGGQGVRESEDWGGHAEAGTKASAGAQHAGAGNWEGGHSKFGQGVEGLKASWEDQKQPTVSTWR